MARGVTSTATNNQPLKNLPHTPIYIRFLPFYPAPLIFKLSLFSLPLSLSLWVLPSAEVRFRAMAEAGGLPKRKVDEEEDGADALQKKRRISGSNFHEDRLQAVSVSSSQEEHDQSKNHKIEETWAQKEQVQAKNQEIDEIMAQKKGKNLLIDIADLLQNLQLVQENLTSLLEAHTKRKEELQHLLEETTGAGRNDQPHVEAANPKPKEPYFDSPF
ncbi:hypothetical protein AMTRI_Chr06g174950 [Amborella trichopoda]